MIEYEDLAKSNKPFEEEFRIAFEEVLRNGKYILGNKLQQFEDEFAHYCSTSYCIGVGNGMDALTIALKALDLTKGSEVIVPANTFVATILAVIHAGLKPVLCEPSLKTYNIEAEQIEKLITLRTKAIIPVHLYGKMCHMDGIMELAKKYGLKVLEDAAQAHGACYKGQKAGSMGHLGAFSFYPVKNLGGLGDGGAITTQEPQLAERAKLLRNYGSSKKYVYEQIGHNSRLDELQAALLSVKLKYMDPIFEHKRNLAHIYFENLKGVALPWVEEEVQDAFHIFAIRHPQRDKLKAYLLEHGIKTEIHYPIPPHRQKALEKFFRGQEFPITEEIHRSVLSLPIAYHHTEADIAYVCKIINQFR